MVNKKNKSKLVEYEENSKLFRGLSLAVPIGALLISSGRAPLFLIFLLVAASIWKNERRTKPWLLLFIYEIVAIFIFVVISVYTR